VASARFDIVAKVPSGARPEQFPLMMQTLLRERFQLRTHQGSKTALLGDNPDPELVKRLSGELAVTANTPPTFLFHTNSDMAVPAENSVHYYLALRRAGVSAEMHIFERGAHGVGLANDDPALSEWSTLLANWLRGRGLVRR
jgi:dipeptidyl aminopeptidase/acylaminoacyl peptidase